jgi:hypothetical protein
MKRDFRQPREGNWSDRRRQDDGYAQHSLENAAFEEYYKAQVGHQKGMAQPLDRIQSLAFPFTVLSLLGPKYISLLHTTTAAHLWLMLP